MTITPAAAFDRLVHLGNQSGMFTLSMQDIDKTVKDVFFQTKGAEGFEKLGELFQLAYARYDDLSEIQKRKLDTIKTKVDKVATDLKTNYDNKIQRFEQGSNSSKIVGILKKRDELSQFIEKLHELSPLEQLHARKRGREFKDSKPEEVTEGLGREKRHKTQETKPTKVLKKREREEDIEVSVARKTSVDSRKQVQVIKMLRDTYCLPSEEVLKEIKNALRSRAFLLVADKETRERFTLHILEGTEIKSKILLIEAGGKCIVDPGINQKEFSDFNEVKKDLGLTAFATDVKKLIEKEKAIMKKAGVKVEDGLTALQSVINLKNKKLAEQLIKNGADLNVKGKEGDTALHLAINDEEIMKLLLDNGADITLTNDKNLTAIDCAVFYCNIKVLELLKARGVKYDVNCRNEAGFTALSVYCGFGNLKIVQFLLNDGADFTIANRGLTAINLAFLNGHKKIVDLLEAKGAKYDVNCRGNNGNTALHFACYRGDLKYIQFLLDEGVDITISNDQGQTLLHKAVENNSYEALQQLLMLSKGKGIIDAQDNDGDTPLLDALDNGNINCALLLIKEGANVKIANKKGETALQLACKKGFLDIANTILKKGEDPNICDKAGNSSLYYSIVNGNEECTKALIAHKAVITDKPNESGNSIFSALLRYGSTSVNQELAKGFLEKNKDINFVREDSFGNTPLHYICEKGNTSLFNDFIEKLRPKDLIRKNIYYETPLELAFDEKLWNESPKKMQVFLKLILKNCLKGVKHQKSIIKEIKEKGIAGFSAYLQDHVKEFLKDAKDVNPLEICILLNDSDLAQKIKANLSEDKFNKYLCEISDKFKPMGDEFCKLQNFFYYVNPAHLQEGLVELPDENAEGVKIDTLLTMFDELYDLDPESVTTDKFEETDRSKESLRNVLVGFIDKVTNRTKYTGTPDTPDELERFYKTIEISQTHIIKKLQSLEGAEGQKRRAEIIKNLIEEVHLCGGKIHSISLDLYMEVCKDESPDFVTGIYKNFADLRRDKLILEVPRDPQSVHDKNKLVQKLGKICGISGSKSEFSDMYSGAGVDIARAKTGFFKRYNSYEIADCMRDNLKESFFYERFEKWAKDNGFNIIPKHFQLACNEIFNNPGAKWEAKVGLIPTNFKNDLIKIAEHLLYDKDDLRDDPEIQNIILEKGYFTPELWMMTDFDKILERGDAAFNDLAPELQEIIQDCKMQGRLDKLFKGKSLGNKVERKEIKNVKATLFKKFCEKYGGPFLSNSQMGELLTKFNVLQKTKSTLETAEISDSD